MPCPSLCSYSLLTFMGSLGSIFSRVHKMMASSKLGESTSSSFSLAPGFLVPTGSSLFLRLSRKEALNSL